MISYVANVFLGGGFDVAISLRGIDGDHITVKKGKTLITEGDVKNGTYKFGVESPGDYDITVSKGKKVFFRKVLTVAPSNDYFVEV